MNATMQVPHQTSATNDLYSTTPRDIPFPGGKKARPAAAPSVFPPVQPEAHPVAVVSNSKATWNEVEGAQALLTINKHDNKSNGECIRYRNTNFGPPPSPFNKPPNAPASSTTTHTVAVSLNANKPSRTNAAEQSPNYMPTSNLGINESPSSEKGTEAGTTAHKKRGKRPAFNTRTLIAALLKTKFASISMDIALDCVNAACNEPDNNPGAAGEEDDLKKSTFSSRLTALMAVGWTPNDIPLYKTSWEKAVATYAPTERDTILRMADCAAELVSARSDGQLRQFPLLAPSLAPQEPLNGIVNAIRVSQELPECALIARRERKAPSAELQNKPKAVSGKDDTTLGLPASKSSNSIEKDADVVFVSMNSSLRDNKPSIPFNRPGINIVQQVPLQRKNGLAPAIHAPGRPNGSQEISHNVLNISFNRPIGTLPGSKDVAPPRRQLMDSSSLDINTALNRMLHQEEMLKSQEAKIEAEKRHLESQESSIRAAKEAMKSQIERLRADMQKKLFETEKEMRKNMLLLEELHRRVEVGKKRKRDFQMHLKELESKARSYSGNVLKN